MKNTEKNILIISHNPLSKVNNNGKTLVSIFKGVPDENIYQIYLNSDVPDYSENCHYIQLNEKQILSSVFKIKNLCCREIKATPEKISSATIKNHSFGNHTKRLLRECVWKMSFWKIKLGEWLKDKHFDVVFFMAGDGLFAYSVYSFVMKNISAKGCMFFTDDYIIGKNSFSPVATIRRCLLKSKIKKTLTLINELYVISDEMRDAYYNLFNVEGYIIRNFSIEKKNTPITSLQKKSGHLVMVYAGGLHYNRWKVLSQIAKHLSNLNKLSEVKCCLKIYSTQNISKKIINQLSIKGASEFLGSASASQIADIYASADILLHVESFEKKAIASTKFSFSTKIPEYLSASKCVLAVGPAEVASVKYLSNFACVASNEKEIQIVLARLMNDDDYRAKIKENCEIGYENDFSEETQKKCLEQILNFSNTL